MQNSGVDRRIVLLGALALGGTACSDPTPNPPPPTSEAVPPPAPRPPVTPATNVKDHGALGNGLVDDRPAIQAALDKAGPGGLVIFPPGRYVLGANPGSDRLLHSYPDQELRGSGRQQSTLIVADNSPHYYAVIGMARSDIACGKWRMTALSIDQNAARGNLVAVPLSALSRQAVALGSYVAGSAVVITACGFLRSDSMNTVYVFADQINISDCHFEQIGGTIGSPSHDHSSIYTTTTIAGGSQQINGNSFSGIVGAGGARTAIETHGGRQTIRHNTISGMSKGANLTGVAEVATESVVFQHNSIDKCLTGVHVWARHYKSFTTGIPIQRLEITDNAIHIQYALWQARGDLPYENPITLDVAGVPAIPQLVIDRNTITHEKV